MQKQMNIDLKCLYKWLLANKISLNCLKTELVIFHKPGYPIRNFNFNIKINGHKIIPTDHIKYLGIYIDSTLSSSYHCEILSNKLTRAIGMFSKVRHYVPKEELKSIYYAIFSSDMVYGCQTWGQRGGSHIEKIIKLQIEPSESLTLRISMLTQILSISITVSLNCKTLSDYKTVYLYMTSYTIHYQSVLMIIISNSIISTSTCKLEMQI